MRKLCLCGERKMRVLKRKRAKNDKNFQKSAIYLDLIKKNDYNQNKRNAGSGRLGFKESDRRKQCERIKPLTFSRRKRNERKNSDMNL